MASFEYKGGSRAMGRDLADRHVVPNDKRKRTRDANDIPVPDELKFGSGREENPHRLEMRMKQIQFGKNTIGYDNYLAAVPKEKRHAMHSLHPRTPDPHEDISKRAFDGKVKMWRRSLHKWDDADRIQNVEYRSERDFGDEKLWRCKKLELVIQPVGAPSPIKNKTTKQQRNLQLNSEEISAATSGQSCSRQEDRSPMNAKRLKIAEDEEPLEFQDEEPIDTIGEGIEGEFEEDFL